MIKRQFKLLQFSEREPEKAQTKKQNNQEQKHVCDVEKNLYII